MSHLVVNLRSSARALVLAVVGCGLLAAGGCSQAQQPAAGSGEKAGKPAAKPVAVDPMFVAEKPPAGAIWLEALDLKLMAQDWGSPHAGKSVEEKPLTLG